MPDWLAPVPALRERIHPSTSTRQVRTLRKGMKLMAAKTMAEVLAEHAFHLITPVTLDDVNGPWQVECNCTTDPIQGPSYLGAEQAFAAHQAAALSAAGFGLVADTKAEAWDHGHHDGAVDAILHMENSGAKTTHNPYRDPS